MANMEDQPTEAASPFAPPQVSMPKGGGAIRGLGEKFQTNSANGTATLTVPVPLSNTRSGFQPAFALSYSSGSGNGSFGLGWSLGLPSITRRTDKGVPRYVPFARRAENVAAADRAADIFLLSGSEDLVPIATDAAPWIAHRVTNGYFVRGYRPRIEGTFARIESWTRIDDGDTHWRTISRDNALTVYGEGAESRISDPEDPQRIFQWLACRSYDDRGNAIEYEYAPEGDDGLDLTRPNERLRSRSAERYLKRIRYGNRVPVLLDLSEDSARRSHLPRPDIDPNTGWLFEVVFDHGDEPFGVEPPAEGFQRVRWSDDAPRPRLQRRDPFSNLRAGFEIRTHRLCRRILVAHRMPEKFGAARTLVRALHLDYDEKPNGTRLSRVTQSGYRLLDDGSYRCRSLPSLLLNYSHSPLDDPTPRQWAVERLPQESLDNLPSGISGDGYQWTDLDGEGIAGVLAEGSGAWYFKPNRGHGRFGPTQVVRSLPVGETGRSQLMDLDSDGRLELATLAQGTGGYFDRTDDEGWTPFRPFRSFPLVDFTDPNVRLTDLSGDGLADILITDDQAITWHPSLGEAGFGEAIRVRVPWNEEGGPRVLLGQADQTVFIADMSGDGLADLVRIRNGEVCYWPNLGHGRFGPKVTMDGSPWFDEEGLFDARRLHFADTDGSGPTDLIYAGRKGVKVFLNESGNALSGPRNISEVVLTEGMSLDVVDLLGRGTACLVWSTALPGIAWRPVQYIDLMCGTKPHLLVRWENQLGSETRVNYASSTEFYLADREAGRPWVTRLPFPVHVVKSIETIDHVARNRFISSYRYHHGHYDGVEREFRGFGMVEQIGSEYIGAPGGTSNWDPAHRLPPVQTKTWFHTGHYDDAHRVSRHYEREYYREADSPVVLPDTIIPPGLTFEEAREACRALKGTTLRSEVYALDDSPASHRPYTVAESNYTIQLVQSRGEHRYGIFHTTLRESVTLAYDRTLYDVGGRMRADPRVAHHMTLRVDDFGNVLQGVSIAYGRRYPESAALLTAADCARQVQTWISCSEGDYSNVVDLPDAFRTPLPVSARRWEIANCHAAARRAHTTNLFGFEEMHRILLEVAAAGREVPADDWQGAHVPAGVAYRRLLDHQRTRYRANDLTGLLPMGVVESLALPGEHYTLAFPGGFIERVFKHRAEESLAALSRNGGYLDLDGDGSLWRPSGRVFYSVDEVPAGEERAEATASFFQARRARDPFGNETRSAFDEYCLAIISVIDAAGNQRTFEYDYRVLAPFRASDPNGNRTELAFDTLAMVTGTAVMGKPGEALGDSLEGFAADLDDATVAAHFENPLANAAALLGGATTRIVYDLDAFGRKHQPAAASSLQRETHVMDLAEAQQSAIQHGLTYSDGFGREIQKKAQAAPGLVEGQLCDPRWVVSGWTVFNNKGQPVREYEPFFSATHRFEFDRRHGVSPILVYDSIGRSVAMLRPDGTYAKTVYQPWREESWDANDTTLLQVRTDPDIASLVGSISEGSAPSWYERRVDGALGADEQAAAARAAVHAGTPAVAHLDALGRSFLAVAHNRVRREGTVSDERLTSRIARDIQNTPRLVEDALGRIVLRAEYDLVGGTIYRWNADAGERWMLVDVGAQPLIMFDGLGRRIRTTHDPLRRPVDLYVRDADAGEERLAEHTTYGEQLPDAFERNLRGTAFQQFDAAGVVTNERFDFKGNLLSFTRQLATDFRREPDWRHSVPLEARVFRSATTYDALNRATSRTTPDGTITWPLYDAGNQMRRVELSFHGAATREVLVEQIEYNAKTQRESVRHGNGVLTQHEYDPLTFRPARTRSWRASDLVGLQDLAYTFDPRGNITTIRDATQSTVFFRNQAVDASSQYEYDALYRLVSATGREHALIGNDLGNGKFDAPPIRSPLPSDEKALRRYREEFSYDGVGNLLEMLHIADGNRWRRVHEYASIAENNRLTGSRVGSTHEQFSYDVHGNILAMPHLPSMVWNHKDRLQFAHRQANGAPDTCFIYDGAGERVRKVRTSHDGEALLERVYVGFYEVERRIRHGRVVERETIHVTDGASRVAIIESRAGTRTMRFQLADHLGSVSVELDEHAGILTREEYYPYGETAFRSEPFAPRVSRKRYRFTGKERDEETGFTYHGARYYAPWLARWISPDPSGMVDGPNLYEYCRSNPIANTDPTGRECNPEISTCSDPVDPSVPDAGALTSSYEDPSTAVCYADEPTMPDPGDPSQYDTFEEFEEANAGSPLSEQGMEDTWAEREWDPADTSTTPVTSAPEADLEPEAAPEPAAEEPTDEGVGEPGLVESLVPVWGSGRESINHFQHGNYVRGTFWGVMAVSDVFLVKALVVGAGKLVIRGGVSVAAHSAPSVAAHAAPEVVAHAAPGVVAHTAPGVVAHTTASVTAHATSAVAGGGNAVYRSVVDGKTIYIGITNNLERRAAEHLSSKGIRIAGIPGLTNLSRADARAIEQVLIEFHGLSKNGGTLINKINSIAKTNPRYADALIRGRQLLQQAGYPGF